MTWKISQKVRIWRNHGYEYGFIETLPKSWLLFVCELVICRTAQLAFLACAGAILGVAGRNPSVGVLVVALVYGATAIAFWTRTQRHVRELKANKPTDEIMLVGDDGIEIYTTIKEPEKA